MGEGRRTWKTLTPGPSPGRSGEGRRRLRRDGGEDDFGACDEATGFGGPAFDVTSCVGDVVGVLVQKFAGLVSFPNCIANNWDDTNEAGQGIVVLATGQVDDSVRRVEGFPEKRDHPRHVQHRLYRIKRIVVNIVGGVYRSLCVSQRDLGAKSSELSSRPTQKVSRPSSLFLLSHQEFL